MPEGKIFPDDIVVEVLAEGEPLLSADRLGRLGNQRGMVVNAQTAWENFTDILNRLDTSEDQGEKRRAFKARCGRCHQRDGRMGELWW
jgi:cytochrome c553